MVLAGVAAYTRVCAYDRPGTIAHLKDGMRRSRSDSIPQPRTASDLVIDLHALLHKAGVPGPFVLVGHSLGGFLSGSSLARMPTRSSDSSLLTHIPRSLKPSTAERWAALVRLNIRQGSDKVEPIPGYGDLETLGYGEDNMVMRRAAASAPLRPIRLSVLAHGRPLDLPAETEGFSSDSLESILRAANEQLATLVPNACFFVAKDSGHDIHQDQPELVTEAIRQVIAGVHSPNTWYDMTSCCVK
jgi:pimeloyl-ACP methyl ester carboxylesterase